jgi:hypothetical protein
MNDATVQDGAKVTVRLRIAAWDNPDITYSDTEKFIQGEHLIPPELEQRVTGLHPGESITFPLSAADAFGSYDETKIQTISPHVLDAREGDPVENVLTGDGPRPAWEAFFFYRHGKRYDKNHERCPRTSEVLESIELCRIADEAPEILFSVLTPGTHIQPHYGVTNTRLVMHLPLVVPPDCALNLIDAGEHHWKEGELMMFDDTFKHEAWNRSSSTRIILLMDCWNPHLTAVEKAAVKQMIETISALHLSEKPRSARVGG